MAIEGRESVRLSRACWRTDCMRIRFYSIARYCSAVRCRAVRCGVCKLRYYLTAGDRGRQCVGGRRGAHGAPRNTSRQRTVEQHENAMVSRSIVSHRSSLYRRLRREVAVPHHSRPSAQTQLRREMLRAARQRAVEQHENTIVYLLLYRIVLRRHVAVRHHIRHHSKTQLSEITLKHNAPSRLQKKSNFRLRRHCTLTCLRHSNSIPPKKHAPSVSTLSATTPNPHFSNHSAYYTQTTGHTRAVSSQVAGAHLVTSSQCPLPPQTPNSETALKKHALSQLRSQERTAVAGGSPLLPREATFLPGGCWVRTVST